MISKASAFAMGVTMLLAFWILRHRLNGAINEVALFLTIAGVGLPITYLLSRPCVANEPIDDA